MVSQSSSTDIKYEDAPKDATDSFRNIAAWIFSFWSSSGSWSVNIVWLKKSETHMATFSIPK